MARPPALGLVLLVMLGLPLCEEFLLLQNHRSPGLPAARGGTFVRLPCYKAIADVQCYRRRSHHIATAPSPSHASLPADPDTRALIRQSGPAAPPIAGPAESSGLDSLQQDRINQRLRVRV